MTVDQEKVKLAHGFKLNVYGKECTHIRKMSGTGIKISPVNCTTSGSAQQQSTVGRASFDPLVIRFGLAPSNAFMLTECVKYMLSPQDGPPRTPISLTEITHKNGTGQHWDLAECFCNRLTLPEGNSGSGQIEVEMEFSLNHKTEVTGGQA